MSCLCHKCADDVTFIVERILKWAFVNTCTILISYIIINKKGQIRFKKKNYTFIKRHAYIIIILYAAIEQYVV